MEPSRRACLYLCDRSFIFRIVECLNTVAARSCLTIDRRHCSNRARILFNGLTCGHRSDAATSDYLCAIVTTCVRINQECPHTHPLDGVRFSWRVPLANVYGWNVCSINYVLDGHWTGLKVSPVVVLIPLTLHSPCEVSSFRATSLRSYITRSSVINTI